MYCQQSHVQLKGNYVHISTMVTLVNTPTNYCNLPFVVVSSKSNSHTRHKLTGCDIFTVPRTSSESSNFKHSSSRAYILHDIIIQTENKRVLGIDMKDQLYLSSGRECQNWVFFACAIHEGISQLKAICK